MSDKRNTAQLIYSRSPAHHASASMWIGSDAEAKINVMPAYNKLL
jgi:hypothetical protein